MKETGKKYTFDDFINCVPEQYREMFRNKVSAKKYDPITEAEKMLGKHHDDFDSDDAVVALGLAMIQK
jgi:hypothetical protein